jgi:glycosyltransferase involved in cell wall biosynthesis
MIGMPVYNGARYLRKALDSLLEQSFTDFRVIVLDDASSDESLPILKDYARRDSRISVFRNSERGGLIAAWNKVAQLAGEEGAPEYFAWYSDHDWVASNWLEAQLKALKQDPSAILATVLTRVVDENGEETGTNRQPLSTAGLDPYDAIQAVTIKDFGAGNAVYGLFRYESLRRLQFLPVEILPDVLLVSAAALEGTICGVDSTIRYRREFEWNGSVKNVLERQRRSLFKPNAEVPLNLSFSHAVYFLQKCFQDHTANGESSKKRLKKLVHACMYLSGQFRSQKNQWIGEMSSVEQGQDVELQWLARFFASDTKKHFDGLVEQIESLKNRLVQMREKKYFYKNSLLEANDRLVEMKQKNKSEKRSKREAKKQLQNRDQSIVEENEQQKK